MKLNKFAKYAWGVLGYNLLVVLWGAYVRATGSGAGCGSHWPLCNGVVIPRSSQAETVIEFVHRLSSGLALILVVILFVWAWRSYLKGHRVRLGAALSLIFMFVEALLGAGLVLFEWVAQDASLGRVISMPLHLVTTFMLLASLAITAWWASEGEALNFKGHGVALWLFVAAGVGIILIGMSGALTALGDTLFPVESVQANSAEASHFLVRLRIWHPVISIIVGVYLLFLSGLIALFRVTPKIRYLTLALALLVVVQLLAGWVNVLLKAPVWMQLVHLFLADLVWLAFVLMSAANFAESEVSQHVSG